MSAPAIKAQVKKIHDQASFLDPTQNFSAQLLVELNKPAVTDEFKALAGNKFVDRILSQAVGGAGQTPDKLRLCIGWPRFGCGDRLGVTVLHEQQPGRTRRPA